METKVIIWCAAALLCLVALGVNVFQKLRDYKSGKSVLTWDDESVFVGKKKTDD